MALTIIVRLNIIIHNHLRVIQGTSLQFAFVSYRTTTSTLVYYYDDKVF